MAEGAVAVRDCVPAMRAKEGGGLYAGHTKEEICWRCCASEAVPAWLLMKQEALTLHGPACSLTLLHPGAPKSLAGWHLPVS